MRRFQQNRTKLPKGPNGKTGPGRALAPSPLVLQCSAACRLEDPEDLWSTPPWCDVERPSRSRVDRQEPTWPKDRRETVQGLRVSITVTGFYVSLRLPPSGLVTTSSEGRTFNIPSGPHQLGCFPSGVTKG